jgi:AbrB family looped-hinge helix DNA binding protein
MVKLITISKDGKVTLPKDVRKEIGLKGEEQYALVVGGGEIVLKRISKDSSRERMLELLKEFRTAFKGAKITRKDVEKEIRAVRNKQK